MLSQKTQQILCMRCKHKLQVCLQGVFDCALQVYLRPGPMPELPEMLCLLLFSLHEAYAFQRRLSLLERRDPRAPDAVALACGVATLLQQYHPSYVEVRNDIFRYLLQSLQT